MILWTKYLDNSRPCTKHVSVSVVYVNAVKLDYYVTGGGRP